MSSAASISTAGVGGRTGGRVGGLLPVVVLVLVLAGVWLSFPVQASASVESGALSQLPSPANCVGDTEEGVMALCGTGVGSGLQLTYQTAVSPDGANVYSVAHGGALIEYSRNPASGALAVIGCITGLTSSPTDSCAPTNAQYGVTVVESLGAIAISPNGKNVYVLDQGKNMVVELSRDTETGLLAVMKGAGGEPECITEEASLCEHTNAIGLSNPYGIAVSLDEETVYVASLGSESVAELARDTSTGTLEAIAGHECIGGPGSGCPENTAIGVANAIGVVVSPDGKDVYVAAGAKGEEGDVASFKRGAGGVLEQLAGEEGCVSEKIVVCAKVKALQGSEDLAISPDGKDVYATSYPTNAIVELKREATGVLTQLGGSNGCVTTNSIAGCTEATDISGPLGVAVSPDGANLYASGSSSNAEAAFARNASTGALTQLGEADPCVTSEASGCGAEFNNAIGLDGARRVAVSPDGTNVYVAGQSSNALVELARTVKPTATDVQPKEGSEAGGEQVTIKGAGFAEGAQVLFGTTPAVSVTVNSATSITAVSPAESVGPQNVEVVNAAGESEVEPVKAKFAFTLATTPTVSGLSASYGPQAGGTIVQITGSEFLAGSSTVRFASTPATNVTVNSGASITATAPAGSGIVDVTVTTSKGTSATSGGDRFKYNFTPPHKLGGLDTTGYCVSLGDHGTEGAPAKLLKGAVEGPEFAFNNWACETNTGTLVPIASAGPAPSENDMCHHEYPNVSSFAFAEEANSAFSWACYETEPTPEQHASTTTTTATTATTATTKSTPAVLAPPTLSRTGNVAPISGRVMVRLPGTRTFLPLSSLRQIPFGTVIDATNGRVVVTTALPHGGTQTGEFFSGEFVLTQGRDGTVVATLTGGDFAVCPTARERAHRARVSSYRAFSSSTSGKHVVRKLWANAHGKFSTKGNYAAGAVQGTEWLTEDLCEGTSIRVTRDKVLVTDLVRHRHKTVKVGHSYLAKAP